MKNQYFGDVNDFRKYGLLRCIQAVTNSKLFMAWMLTLDDDRNDGQAIKYLKSPEKFRECDPLLFDWLKGTVDAGKRNVAELAKSDLFSETDFYTEVVPDNRRIRDVWFSVLMEKARAADFVFLDPDNGFEITSKKYGAKQSSKYLFWHEARALTDAGKSLIVYQHFIREKRDEFITNLVNKIKCETGLQCVQPFVTSHVVFFVVLQPRHAAHLPGIIEMVEESWGDEIRTGASHE